MYKIITKAGSFKKTFFWNMTGSVSNALNTILMTMVISRYCGIATAGIYSLAIAVAEMFGPITTFQIRNYQSSDVKSKFTFFEYFITRLLTSVFAFGCAVFWIVLHGYSYEKITVIMLCTLFKIVEAIEDVFGGHLQLNDYLHIASKTFACRIIASTSLVIVLLFFTKNLLFSYSVYIIFCVFWIILITYPCTIPHIHSKEFKLEKVFSLIKECLPLCITQFLIAYIISSPKYALDKYFVSDYQTYFAAIFMPASFVNLFTSVVFRIYITDMAVQWNNNEKKVFNIKILKVIAMILFIGVLSIVGGAILGIPLLAWFYNIPKLKIYRLELIVILIGGTFSAITSWLGIIFTIARKQKLLIYINIITFLISLIFTDILVKHYCMMGAALAYMILMIVIALLQLCTYCLFINKSGGQKSKTAMCL